MFADMGVLANLGQLLALKRIELESPAKSQIEDNFKGFPMVI